MPFIILIFSFLIALIGASNMTYLSLPESELSILRQVVINNMPPNPIPKVPPKLWKIYVQTIPFATSTTVPRSDVDQTTKGWGLPLDVVNQFHLIAYSENIQFATFYLNAFTPGPHTLIQYFGAARYDSTTENVDLALISVTTILICKDIVVTPFCLIHFTNDPQKIIPWLAFFGCQSILAAVPPSSYQLQSDPPIDQLRQDIDRLAANVPNIQNDMRQQMSQANAISQNMVGKFNWFQSVASSQLILRVNDKDFNDFLNYLVKIILKIPTDKQQDALVSLGMILFSETGQWIHESILFASPSGSSNFVWIGGYHDFTNTNTDWIYGTFSASFDYAPDVYSHDDCKREFFVFKECDTVYEYFPHPMNEYDRFMMLDLMELSLINQMSIVVPH
jgi:hypothetical protein